MPYDLKQVSKRPSRWVVITKATGRPHSKEGMTKKQATAQMRALYLHAGDGVVDLKDLLEGEGVLSDVLSFLTGTYPGEKQLREILQKHGEAHITSARVFREPVKGALEKIVNWLTKGEVQKHLKKYGRDSLFHISLYFTLDDGTDWTFEKNSYVTLHRGKYNYGVQAQSVPVPIPTPGPEFREVIRRAVERAGKKDFWTYSPFSRNCGDAIYNLLKASGLLTEEARVFINQDVLDIAEKYPAVAKVMETITDIHGSLTGRK